MYMGTYPLSGKTHTLKNLVILVASGLEQCLAERESLGAHQPSYQPHGL